MDEGTRLELESAMRAIHDTDDFALGVLALVKTEENAEKMLAFLARAREVGDEVTHDDALLVALALNRGRL